MFRSKAGGEGYEDSTPNFLARPVICEGLRWLDTVGIHAVQAHVATATEIVLVGLKQLGDSIQIYGPQGVEERGGKSLRCSWGVGTAQLYERLHESAPIEERRANIDLGFISRCQTRATTIQKLLLKETGIHAELTDPRRCLPRGTSRMSIWTWACCVDGFGRGYTDRKRHVRKTLSRPRFSRTKDLVVAMRCIRLN
jgi:hypothetical protein